MRDDYFNPETYMVIDRVTGEEVPVSIFMDEVKGKYWERAYAGVLAEYIDVLGNSSTKVLGAILKSKDSNNMLNYTVQELADETGVSKPTANKVFVALAKKELIKKIRNGKYFVSPMIMRHGSKTRGVMLLRLWGENDTKNDNSGDKS